MSCYIEYPDNPTAVIKLPTNFAAIGPCLSGKTSLFHRIFLNHEKIFSKPVEKILYSYNVWVPEYSILESKLGSLIEFIPHIPTREELIELHKNIPGEKILCLDDIMNSLYDNSTGKKILEIITVLSHNLHCSVFFSIQNLFHSSKVARAISLNIQYFCLFRNNRSADQIRHFARQITPQGVQFVFESYLIATQKRYSYILIDLSPSCDPKFQLKSNFLSQEPLTIFLPKK